jgi:hypothetical protein
LINLLSLIAAPEAGPAVSTNSSAPTEMNFSALLTELMGPVENAALPEVEPKLPQPEPQSEPHDSLTTSPILPSEFFSIPPTLGDVNKFEITMPCEGENPLDLSSAAQLSASPKPEMLPPAVAAALDGHPILDDLKKFEITIEHEVEKPVDLSGAATLPAAPKTETIVPAVTAVAAGLSELPILDDVKKSEAPVQPLEVPAQRSEAPVQRLEAPVQREAVKPAEAELPESFRQAVVTTDPIVNLRQPQLPLRVVAIQKVMIETRLPERKSEPGATKTTEATTSPVPGQFTNPARTIEAIDQPRPAHVIEIPNLPKLQVVRTVSMEVGDADSQITIRIQDRGNGMNLHFGTGSETLHRDLESSVASLVRALKRDQIDISNVEVSRKSPIEKVRRMKEARNG